MSWYCGFFILGFCVKAVIEDNSCKSGHAFCCICITEAEKQRSNCEVLAGTLALHVQMYVVGWFLYRRPRHCNAGIGLGFCHEERFRLGKSFHTTVTRLYQRFNLIEVKPHQKMTCDCEAPSAQQFIPLLSFFNRKGFWWYLRGIEDLLWSCSG